METSYLRWTGKPGYGTGVQIEASLSPLHCDPLWRRLRDRHSNDSFREMPAIRSLPYSGEISAGFVQNAEYSVEESCSVLFCSAWPRLNTFPELMELNLHIFNA